MNPCWSDLVCRLAPYTPGEQPKLERLVKLNTNENPYPPSPRAVAAMRAVLAEDGALLARYPDPEGRLLKEAVVRHYRAFNLDPAQVFVGNGSDEVLALVFQALLKHDAPLLMPDVSYSFYPVYCGLYDIDFVQVPLTENFVLNTEDYRNRPCGSLIFPNPNAPTGRAIGLDEIEILARAHPNAPLVVDEAYVDFGAETAIALIHRHANVLIVQTLSKSRALAGLRAGFAVGHPDLIEALTRVKNCFNSYPLDRLALAGAAAAMEDEVWFEANRHAVMASRETLAQSLVALGFEVLPSAANFLFARHPRRDAKELAQQLREARIIVRHFRQPRIEQYLRISIGTPEECAALVAALACILGHSA
ncbi:MAG: histidinol-phosphate transaminase [Zoogloeaceae bacterium]|jgi:histidinol-phosphate aminotransferase|nr:histidinol-phosphate transaminase [Zoogloeaceae bacterium]